MAFVLFDMDVLLDDSSQDVKVGRPVAATVDAKRAFLETDRPESKTIWQCGRLTAE